MPLSWTITRYVPQHTFEKLALSSHVYVYPTPMTPHEEKEWRRFSSYLQNKKMVAIVRSEQYCFCILPPERRANPECAKVAYMVEGVLDSHGNKKHALTADGDTMGQITSIVPLETNRMHVTRPINPNPASVYPKFLENLGQPHDWIFGAIAELVDNARDAKASRLHIFIDKLYYDKTRTSIPVLSVVDDGLGMTHEGLLKMVSLGHKMPSNGFKAGAMRLGKDALVLTQARRTRSIAFLSQSLNKGKDTFKVPIITYERRIQAMVLDTSCQSKSLANDYMEAIFDEFFIGEKFSKFDRDETGTQIFLWNLDRYDKRYTLECQEGEIVTCHRQLRPRHGQVRSKVPLDYSLNTYLEVIFLDPRMKIYVQGSKVKSYPVAKFLSKTVVENGTILGKSIQLILGFSRLAWEQENCGIFLYCRGRLIEAYKRVGVMVRKAEMGRGVIGVIDVSTLMVNDNGGACVLSNKQGFFDECEPYVQLEEWLTPKVNAYCTATHVDPLRMEEDDSFGLPDNEWVRCEDCRKWRKLASGVKRESISGDWFCHLEPFKGKCSTPEEAVQPGVVTVSTRRSGHKDDHDSEDDYEDGEVR